MRTTNQNGLTYFQWYTTAHFGTPKERSMRYSNSQLKKAWEQGECPCDWAAWLHQKGTA